MGDYEKLFDKFNKESVTLDDCLELITLINQGDIYAYNFFQRSIGDLIAYKDYLDENGKYDNSLAFTIFDNYCKLKLLREQYGDEIDICEMTANNIAATSKHLFSKLIKKHTIGEILLFSIMIYLNYYLRNGVYTFEQIYDYYVCSIKKELVVDGNDYSFIFLEYDYTKFLDCVCSSIMLSLLLINITDSAYKGAPLMIAIKSKAEMVKKIVYNSYCDPLYYKNVGIIRQTVDSFLNEDYFGNYINSFNKNIPLDESAIEDYGQYMFVNFDIDPLGNGFVKHYIVSYLNESQTISQVESYKKDFLEQLRVSKESVKNKIISLYPDLSLERILRLEKGNDDSKFYAACSYMFGIYVDQNFKKVFGLFKSMIGYNCEAFYYLSQLCYTGLGTERDINNYVEYLLLAASFENKNAIEELNEIFKKYLIFKKYKEIQVEYKRIVDEYNNKGLVSSRTDSHNNENDYIIFNSLEEINDYYFRRIKMIDKNYEMSEWKETYSSIFKEQVDKRRNKQK